MLRRPEECSALSCPACHVVVTVPLSLKPNIFCSSNLLVYIYFGDLEVHERFNGLSGYVFYICEDDFRYSKPSGRDIYLSFLLEYFFS
jgi:hypothetical protein